MPATKADTAAVAIRILQPRIAYRLAALIAGCRTAAYKRR
jgi:hypothetical protein